jgi:eukaryotic-like serine/threonine-protein kinase
VDELDGGLLTALSGRYEIERVIGRGGMAVVYLARDLKHNRSVALKVLRPEFSHAPDNRRFAREIDIAAQLVHPNILSLHDSDEIAGFLYYVMPYAESVTLRERLRSETQLSIDDVLEITRQVAAALDYAHAHGVVHRDIKPENILLQGDQVFVVDFGIAKALAEVEGERLTAQGMLIGTPEYMSPEQCTPGSVITHRSDIYALGCVVFEMVAGMPPFRGATPTIIFSHHLTTEPPSLCSERRACPRELDAAVRRALAKVPADRFHSAGEFAAACRPPATPKRPSRIVSLGGSRRVAIAAALAACVGGVAIATKTLSSGPPPRSPETVGEGDPRRIAVLYFQNLSPDHVPGYVADGITEDLIDQLGGAGALHVISPDGVRAYRGTALSTDSVGKLLKVGTIVSGSVYRADTAVVVHVRLVDAKGGRQLYSRSLSLPWAELFTLQSKLAEEVAFLLRQRLGDEVALREHRAATKSAAAWAAVYMGSSETRRALIESNLRGSAQGPLLFLRADSLYARANELDPHWILPTLKRGRLALALSFGSTAAPPGIPQEHYDAMSADQRRVAWIERAVQLANDAVRKEPASAEALALRADARFALIGDVSNPDSLSKIVEQDVRTSLELRPDLASTWATRAQIEQRNGLFADAAADAQRAFDADAFFEVPRIAAIGFQGALYATQFADARKWCRLGLDHYPGDPRFTECELTLLGWTGRSQREAAAAWQLLDGIERRDSLHILAATWGYRRLMVATLLARAGMGDSARHLLARVAATRPEGAERRDLLLADANIRLLLGDRDGAVTGVADYLRAAPRARAQVAKHPWFLPLRNDPRYAALIRGT